MQLCLHSDGLSRAKLINGFFALIRQRGCLIAIPEDVDSEGGLDKAKSVLQSCALLETFYKQP